MAWKARNKDLQLQDEYDKVSKQALDSGARCESLRQQRTALQQELDSLSAQYQDECRRHVDGEKGADPAAVMAESDRQRHKLNGLDSLIQSADAVHQPLATKLQQLGEQILCEQEDAELETLITKQQNLRDHVMDLQNKLGSANKDLLNSTHELSAIRRKIEYRRRAVA